MLKRNQKEFVEKLQAQMEKEGMDALLLTKPESIYYATGVASSFMYMGSAVGTVLGVVPKTGNVAIVTTEFETSLTKLENPDIEIVAYPIFVYVADFDSAGRVKEVQPDTNRTFKMAADLIQQKVGAVKKLGVERAAMPYDKMLALQEVFGADALADCGKVLIESAATKTPWEIEVLRKNAQASHEAMHYVARNTQPGMSEEDMNLLWNQALVNAGKEFTRVYNATVIGEQFSPYYVPHAASTIKAGDMVRLDGGVCSNGYSSDLARTYAVGGVVNDERRKIWEILHETHEKALQMIGPGVRMCDVFRFAEDNVKTVIPSYNRGHFGHSIGCNLFCEEYPMINPNETRVFEPGMVLCVEIPYYSSFNNSYNIEDTILITENGIDCFTKSNEDIFWK